MTDLKDKVFEFSNSQLNAFEVDVVWRSFTRTILDRLEIIRSELESGVVLTSTKDGVVSTPLSLDEIRKRQGECLGLRYVLKLPEIIKEIREQGEQKKEK